VVNTFIVLVAPVVKFGRRIKVKRSQHRGRWRFVALTPSRAIWPSALLVIAEKWVRGNKRETEGIQTICREHVKHQSTSIKAISRGGGKGGGGVLLGGSSETRRRRRRSTSYL